MRALVTGGAGFIGSHLVDALVERGDDVHVLDDLSTGKRENVNAKARLHWADVRTPDYTIDRIKPEAIYHLAAQADIRKSLADPGRDAQINTIGTIRILEAARRYDCKIAFASTGGAIYGECDGAIERDACQPISPYGAGKLCAEEYLRTWGRLYGTDHVALRFANVYGPRQDPDGEAGVVAIFIGLMRQNKPVTIYGDGMQIRDYVYVADVVRALLAAMESSRSFVYNVGTSEGTSVNTLYERLQLFAEKRLSAVYAPARLGELERGVLNARRAERELGWTPTYTLREGLEETWNNL